MSEPMMLPMMLPQGFTAAALAAQIKPSGKPDLSSVISSQPCAWAFAGTLSTACAASVVRNRTLYENGGAIRVLLVNAGNANAATGIGGAQDNGEMAARAALELECKATEVLTASTGIIGHRLPMKKVHIGISQLAEHLSSELDPFSEAIMTTDTHAKRVERTLSSGAKIVGTAKGSGMIHPNMATMFAFVFSDAQVDQTVLRSSFPDIVDRTFNAVTVDGDTSTSDQAIVLCNGLVEADPLEFLAALESVMRELARMIARDGEGATKLLTVQVTGAATEKEALAAARTVAGSALLKSAVYGNDPNWGRVIAALGRSGSSINFDHLEVAVQGIPVFAGQPLEYDTKSVSNSMKAEEVIFDLNLAAGSSSGVAWGCDLTEEYVKINAEYTT
jgi:glutamate N-acetyltransferase / amino-acid N-acetyltransferase